MDFKHDLMCLTLARYQFFVCVTMIIFSLYVNKGYVHILFVIKVATLRGVFRELDGCDHFEAIFTLLPRRVLYKNILKNLNFRAKIFGFFSNLVLDDGHKYNMSKFREIRW